ncbi:MAG: DUF1934 domain-containing protein [Clostridia bacterium]|nr:DUF1934 domain-containing protein [Clostridia bacterium]
MKEDFLITMVTHQNVEGEKQVLEMTSVADFSGSADDYYISYVDSDGDMKGCRTTLHVEKGELITIRREGDFDSHIIVEKNTRHVSHHNTPYGIFTMGISAIDVESVMTGEGGKLRFRYATDIDMHPVGEIEFDITVSQRKN